MPRTKIKDLPVSEDLKAEQAKATVGGSIRRVSPDVIDPASATEAAKTDELSVDDDGKTSIAGSCGIDA